MVQILGFWAFPGERMGGMACNFAHWCMLTTFRTGFRTFPGEPTDEMACYFACWCILTTFKTEKVMVTVCWFFIILALFWISEMGQIWGFRAFWLCFVDFPHYYDPLTETGHIWGFWVLSGECVGVNVEGIAGGIFPTLCVDFWLVIHSMCFIFNLQLF